MYYNRKHVYYSDIFVHNVFLTLQRMLDVMLTCILDM